MDRAQIVRTLAANGCVAPEEEATELLRATHRGTLDELVARRIRGEPLAWIVGSVAFCGLRVEVDVGVFVPRPHTEALARRAAALLRDDGVAVDLCTGSGALAIVLAVAHPAATILATDLDPAAVACARRNGVHALPGDLDQPLPRSLAGRVDVVTAVVPYVPVDELHLLPRDVVAHEPRVALDGGRRGIRTLVRATEAAARLLRPGGVALLELGGDQADALAPVLVECGFTDVTVRRDEEGDVRAVDAVRT